MRYLVNQTDEAVVCNDIVIPPQGRCKANDEMLAWESTQTLIERGKISLETVEEEVGEKQAPDLQLAQSRISKADH